MLRSVLRTSGAGHACIGVGCASIAPVPSFALVAAATPTGVHLFRRGVATESMLLRQRDVATPASPPAPVRRKRHPPRKISDPTSGQHTYGRQCAHLGFESYLVCPDARVWDTIDQRWCEPNPPKHAGDREPMTIDLRARPPERTKKVTTFEGTLATPPADGTILTFEVAELFLSSRYRGRVSPHLSVKYLDGDGRNVSASNLEWVPVDIVAREVARAASEGRQLDSATHPSFPMYTLFSDGRIYSKWGNEFIAGYTHADGHPRVGLYEGTSGNRSPWALVQFRSRLIFDLFAPDRPLRTSHRLAFRDGDPCNVRIENLYAAENVRKKSAMMRPLAAATHLAHIQWLQRKLGIPIMDKLPGSTMMYHEIPTPSETETKTKAKTKGK